MVQVLTVSATTAAFVADSIKSVQRAPRKMEIEQAARELARKTGKSGESQLNQMVAVVSQPALSLHFLTAGKHQNPQATLEEVIEAYEENKAASD